MPPGPPKNTTKLRLTILRCYYQGLLGPLFPLVVRAASLLEMGLRPETGKKLREILVSASPRKSEQYGRKIGKYNFHMFRPGRRPENPFLALRKLAFAASLLAGEGLGLREKKGKCPPKPCFWAIFICFAILFQNLCGGGRSQYHWKEIFT